MNNVKYVNFWSTNLINTLEEITDLHNKDFDVYLFEKLDKLFFKIINSNFPKREDGISEYYLRVNSIIIIEAYSLYVF